MQLQHTLDFLAELAANNNKPWFDAHRGQYTQARTAFEQLVGSLITVLHAEEDLGSLTPKGCMFRINRDVRFSHDKSPYHISMSAAIGAGGRHGGGRSYYLHLAPNDSFIAGGLYEADKTALENLRQHLAQDPQPFRAILSEPTFVKYFGSLQGETLKTAPSGYDRNHPAIDLLRHKQFLAMHHCSDAEIVDPGFVGHVVATCTAMRPFLDYLQSATSAPHI